MPRRRSRSPIDRIPNRRPNFNSPQKRIGAQMSRPMGRFSRSPRRSRSPGRHQNARPAALQQQHEQRIRSAQRMGNDRSRNFNAANSFPRTARLPMKRSKSPARIRHKNSSSTSPLNKKMMLRKSSPLIRADKAAGLGRGMRDKRISVSPNVTRRKRTPTAAPPPGRMETSVRRDSSRLTIASTLGHAKRDFGSPPRIRGRLSHSPIAMKKESHNDKAQDRRVKPNKPFRLDSNSRNQLEVFQGAEKIGPGGDVLLAPVRNFRNEFAANVAPETTFCHDRRDMKRFQSGNLEEEVYGRKNAERMFRPEEQVMSGPAYDPEELKKITVDIRRSIPRDGEIIVRRITNPEQVVLVRRPEEGARPIFDRDEIKQGNLEREEEFREKRVVAIVRERGRSRSPIPTMDTQSEMHENFKVHRVNSYDAEAFQARPSLSDRWQHDRKSANEKSGNEKLLVSVRPGSPQQMIRKLTNYRGHDIPDELIDEQLYRNIRSMVYRDDATMPRMSSRDSNERHHDGFDTRRPIPTNPHDLRHSLISRGRPVDLLDARQKILERQEREPVHQEAYERNKDRGGSLERAPRSSTVTWDRERIREKILEGLPNFAARRDRYQYKEWIDKPDVVPKGPSYFEHDTRGEGNLEFRRGQGYRGGAGRGSGSSFRSRGAFRARGRPSSFTTNYVTRHIVERGRTDQVGGLGKRSPHQWEHDMFEPADKMKMDEDARPI